MNFLKIILFLIVVIGIAAYFLSHAPSFLQSGPREKILSPAASPAPKSQISSPSNQIPEYQIPSGYTKAQISPYFQKVRISSAVASNYYAYPTQIQLYASLSDGQKINITDWRITTNRVNFQIPQAIGNYEFSSLSPQQDIVISGNASVNIYSNKSPINANFRLNKCTGFLQESYSFSPALPLNCPLPNRSEVSYLSGQCQNYVFSLGHCDTPSIDMYNSLPGNDQGNSCRQFLSNISANSCVRNYRWDSDFFTPNGSQSEWRIWLNWTGVNSILDSSYDRVRLFDNNGLLVDQYIY